MKLIIYGNGRIARIIHQFVKAQYEVVGFTVDSACLREQVVAGCPVLPFEDIEVIYPPCQFSMLVAVGYSQMNKVRQQKALDAKTKGYTLVNYIHPSVHIHDDLIIGENNVILDHVSLQPAVKIGNNNFLWSNAVVAHGCTVEDNCWVTSGATIAGDSIIRSNSFLGINSTVGHNVVIGPSNFIGANSLIVRSTEADAVYISRETEKYRFDSERFLRFTQI
jgi:sugar O-acyltransferase (sialic acid O-acetyltransferase NeuD family)